MSPTVKTVVGGTLVLGGGAILLLGLFTVMFFVAWSNASLRDVLLILMIILYALPAGVALVLVGTWAVRSANQEGYGASSTQSQRKLGILLLLPSVAAVVLLIWGYPHYRFWLYSSTLAVLLVLLAFAMAGSGIYLFKQLRSRDPQDARADPR